MVSRRDDPIAGAASSNETDEGWRLRQRRPRQRRHIHTTTSRSTVNRAPRRQHEFRPEHVSWSGFCAPCPSRHTIKRSRARTTNAVKTNTRICRRSVMKMKFTVGRPVKPRRTRADVRPLVRGAQDRREATRRSASCPRRHHDSLGFAMIFESLVHFAAGQPGRFGAGMAFAAPTRFQSRPSISAESCAVDNRITLFSIFGHTHARPVPENRLYPVGTATFMMHPLVRSPCSRTSLSSHRSLGVKAIAPWAPCRTAGVSSAAAGTSEVAPGMS